MEKKISPPSPDSLSLCARSLRAYLLPPTAPSRILPRALVLSLRWNLLAVSCCAWTVPLASPGGGGGGGAGRGPPGSHAPPPPPPPPPLCSLSSAQPLLRTAGAPRSPSPVLELAGAPPWILLCSIFPSRALLGVLQVDLRVLLVLRHRGRPHRLSLISHGVLVPCVLPCKLQPPNPLPRLVVGPALPWSAPSRQALPFLLRVPPSRHNEKPAVP
jgi:hypothetical protein